MESKKLLVGELEMHTGPERFFEGLLRAQGVRHLTGQALMKRTEKCSTAMC